MRHLRCISQMVALIAEDMGQFVPWGDRGLRPRSSEGSVGKDPEGSWEGSVSWEDLKEKDPQQGENVQEE